MTIYGEGVSAHVVTLELDQTVQLTAEPADRGLDWHSDQPHVATVSDQGLVTAVGLVEAVVTVYPKDYEHAAISGCSPSYRLFYGHSVLIL